MTDKSPRPLPESEPQIENPAGAQDPFRLPDKAWSVTDLIDASDTELHLVITPELRAGLDAAYEIGGEQEAQRVLFEVLRQRGRPSIAETLKSLDRT